MSDANLGNTSLDTRPQGRFHWHVQTIPSELVYSARVIFIYDLHDTPTAVHGLPRIVAGMYLPKGKKAFRRRFSRAKDPTIICKMHHPLTPNGCREYYITSVERGRYLGDAGCFPPYPIALLDPGVQGHKFTVTEARGDNTYTIQIGGQVRGRNDRVYSFGDGLAEEWVIIFREADRAYTGRLTTQRRLLLRQTYLTPCKYGSVALLSHLGN
ncbi:hypothetical protein EDD16DRAFT_1730456 [Pisolithus croceorrhizus]|nr:hypothetical protein EDD16DRAFT_1730456 [Pisolithus croceorrhizus]